MCRITMSAHWADIAHRSFMWSALWADRFFSRWVMGTGWYRYVLIIHLTCHLIRSSSIRLVTCGSLRFHCACVPCGSSHAQPQQLLLSSVSRIRRRSYVYCDGLIIFIWRCITFATNDIRFKFMFDIC